MFKHRLFRLFCWLIGIFVRLLLLVLLPFRVFCQANLTMNDVQSQFFEDVLLELRLVLFLAQIINYLSQF